MQWAFTTHVRWHHAKYGTTGRLWQGRFKAFLIQQDHHLLTVMRYVERNALRAKLVERAEDWKWGSCWRPARHAPVEICESPVPLPSYWRHLVNEPQTAAEIAEIRTCVNRQRPFGEQDWVSEQARALGIEQSLRALRPPAKVQVCPRLLGNEECPHYGPSQTRGSRARTPWFTSQVYAASVCSLSIHESL